MEKKNMKYTLRRSTTKKPRPALFITIEGAEASGKSSVIAFLEEVFKRQGFRVMVFREPGSTRIGEKIRNILLDKSQPAPSPHTELLLYLAARTQLIEEKLTAAFKRYDLIICDRFYDSTLVYQGYALGLGAIARKGVELFSLGVIPDLTIILDGDVKRSLKRLTTKDRIESRPVSFHLRLRRGFRFLAKEYPARIRLVSTDRPLEQVCDEVKNIVSGFICRKRKKKS